MLSKHLSLKERKILKGFQEGKTKTEIGMENYNLTHRNNAPSLVCNTIRKPIVHLRMKQYFDELGLGESQIAQALTEKTKAKKTTYFSNRGVVTDERKDDDHQIQLKALELVAGITGLLVHRNANLNVNMNMDNLSNMKNQDLDYMLSEIDKQLESIKD